MTDDDPDDRWEHGSGSGDGDESDADDEASWFEDAADAASGFEDAADTGSGFDDAAGDADDASREPLGSLRDRVVDDGDEPSVAFPTAGGANDVADGREEEREYGGAARGSAESVGDDREGPLGELAADVDARRERREAGEDELFESMDVGEVDADALWEQVETEEPSVATPDSREIREVDKRKYCASCPYFSQPPVVHCEHDGSDILGQVDMETFEVADCPIVLEDERLEDATTD